MTREYTLTEAQLERLRHASRPRPLILIGGIEAPSAQDIVNDVWREIAGELGFVWHSVQPIPGGSESVFTATPTIENDPIVVLWNGQLVRGDEEWTLLEEFGARCGGRARALEFMSPLCGVHGGGDHVFDEIDPLCRRLKLDVRTVSTAASILRDRRGCSLAEAYERLVDNLQRFERNGRRPTASAYEWRRRIGPGDVIEIVPENADRSPHGDHAR
jgi:hypothetical protein